MSERIVTRSSTRNRQQSIDTDDGRQLLEDLGDIDFGADSSSAQVKQEEETQQRPTTRRSPAKPIPVPKPNPEASSVPSGSHESSGSAFISGIMNNSGNSAGGALSHTPPTAMGTSYEAQHFGKRPRSGSVSGRLRSASDLEDKGIIDRNQKAILKDLIISGDEELQSALDRYEKGDTATLEHMIRSGELQNRATADIDLLGDLDLDFLTVDDHFGDGNIAPLQQQQTKGAQQTTPTMVSPHDDGIGDLDLHGEFANADYLQLGPTAATAAMKQAPPATEQVVDTRFRSNSLAYGPLLNEGGGGSDTVQYGRWMDLPQQTRDGRVDSISSHNSGIVLQAAPGGANIPVGGIAESLAQYGKTTGSSSSKSEVKLTKAQQAELRRRERQEKKEQKEREKKERKERRERESREKKEREAREKKERKERKVAAKKQKQQEEEEPKEVPSGLGLPRSLSDSNLFTTTIDDNGLRNVERPEGWVGAYSPESRKIRIDRFMAKRNHRVWTKKVKYDVRKNFADSRLRVKGRFVKKEDELLMRDLMSLT